MWTKPEKSITREPLFFQVSLKEFYEKVKNHEFQHQIKILKEKKGEKKEAFEILTVLGKGRTGFTFLSRYHKKFTALRMSYDDEDFTGKFDSVIELMGKDYTQSFLDVLYPSMPVQHLYCGKLKKKNEIWFDKTVYVSFWEKAEALLEDKLEESFEKKFKWFQEFIKGLSIIHSKNRAHFDIKLENLFLVEDCLKIGDFEFYWKVRDFIEAKEYLYCGSIGYIAPEMFYHRENITSKVDIFSAGVAFARLFTGENYQKNKLNPPENRQIKEILQKCENLGQFDRKHMAEIKESLGYSFFYRRLLQDKIKAGSLDAPGKFLYEEILLEMMNPEPANRTDIYELIDKLGIKEPPIQEGSRIIDVEPRKPPHLLGWWLIIAFLVTAAAGLFFYFFIYNEGKSQEPSPTAKVKLTIKPPAETRQIVKPSPGEEKEKLRNRAKYDAYLDIARDLVKGKEYEKALDMVARAREIKKTDELLELEQTIKQLIEKEALDTYKKFYQEAWRFYRQENYEEALKNIEMARKIKDTPQSTSLELQIKRKLQGKDEEYERGLELVEENIVKGDYLYAKELIAALKEIKIGDRLLQLEREVNQKLALAAQLQQEQEKEYIKHLQKAQEYMDNGEYEQAEEEIKKSRKIKNSELLQRLEEKLKDLKGQTQQEYQQYTKWARIYLEHGDLEKAKQYLELAKEINRSHELVVLEEEIEEKTREREREEAEKKTDDEAYFNAVRSGQVWDLDEYIREHPGGRHVQEAKEKLDQILEDFIPRIEEVWVIKRSELVYRRSTRIKRIPGMVWLEAVIDIHGNVIDVDVTEGERLLRDEAIEAVKQSKYKPFIIGGEPRVVRLRFKVLFGQPTEY